MIHYGLPWFTDVFLRTAHTFQKYQARGECLTHQRTFMWSENKPEVFIVFESSVKHLKFWMAEIVGNKAYDRISKRVFQENKTRQNFGKTDISYPVIRTRMNVLFSENLACFVFLKHSFWDSPFCLITGELSKGCI